MGLRRRSAFARGSLTSVSQRHIAALRCRLFSQRMAERWVTRAQKSCQRSLSTMKILLARAAQRRGFRPQALHRQRLLFNVLHTMTTLLGATFTYLGSNCIGRLPNLSNTHYSRLQVTRCLSQTESLRHGHYTWSLISIHNFHSRRTETVQVQTRRWLPTVLAFVSGPKSIQDREAVLSEYTHAT